MSTVIKPAPRTQKKNIYTHCETLTSVVLMLAHRLRRRPNIKTTLGECLVFAGKNHQTRCVAPMLVYCWRISQTTAVPTLNQHWVDVSRLMCGLSVIKTGLAFRIRGVPKCHASHYGVLGLNHVDPILCYSEWY